MAGLTYRLFKNEMKPNMSQDSSVKPLQDAEFQHACMLKGVQTTARARLLRLMMLGSLPSLSYKDSSVPLLLEVMLRWLEDAS